MVDNPFVAPPPATTIAGGEVDPDAPQVYRLPRIDAVPGVVSDERHVRSVLAPAPPVPTRLPPDVESPVAEVGPLPPHAPDEMLDAMDELWSGSFEAESDPYADDDAMAYLYTPRVAELSTQLIPSVRKAYGLAQRGALYAAQAEFIQVLRRIAQAKDAEHGTDEHSRALAAGLRALDEADDFTPGGVQLEAEMNVAVVASSHRTPVWNRRSEVLPHEAMARYHQYAEQQLGQAVAGEQAGSMALHGLGKICLRLSNESEGVLRHERKAMAMFLAALTAGPDNHLAANEVGVLLAHGGHPAEAATMFKRAIDVAPISTSYHNLAVVERKLGQHVEAAANERYSQQLAARDRAAGAASRSKGVEWVSPDELARAGQSPIPPAHPMNAPMARRTSQPNAAQSRWQTLVPSLFRR